MNDDEALRALVDAQQHKVTAQIAYLSWGLDWPLAEIAAFVRLPVSTVAGVLDTLAVEPTGRPAILRHYECPPARRRPRRARRA